MPSGPLPPSQNRAAPAFAILIWVPCCFRATGTTPPSRRRNPLRASVPAQIAWDPRRQNSKSKRLDRPKLPRPRAARPSGALSYPQKQRRQYCRSSKCRPRYCLCVTSAAKARRRTPSPVHRLARFPSDRAWAVQKIARHCPSFCRELYRNAASPFRSCPPGPRADQLAFRCASSGYLGFRTPPPTSAPRSHQPDPFVSDSGSFRNRLGHRTPRALAS